MPEYLESYDLCASQPCEDLLPVFGFEEEARVFLWAQALEQGWGARLTSTGEVVDHARHRLCAGVIGSDVPVVVQQTVRRGNVRCYAGEAGALAVGAGPGSPTLAD